MSTMDKTELIESLRNRIAAFRNGHADQVLDRHALAEAAELLDRARDDRGRLPIDAAETVAWLRWSRFQALPDIDDQADLQAAMNLFVKLAAIDLNLVPEELSSHWPGGAVRPKRSEAISRALESPHAAFDTGRKDAMDRAIGELADLLDVLPHDDADRPAMLSNLGIALRARSPVTAGTADIDQAIDALREAVALTDTEDSDRVDFLENLMLALQSRLEVTSSSDDLNEIIEVGRQLMSAATDSDSSDRGLSLLADALETRAERTGSSSDAEEVVSVRRHALEITSPTDQSWPGRLSNLGIAFGRLFERTGRIADLDMAIEVGRIAAMATLPENPDRAGVLFNVFNALQAKWRRSGQEAILTEMIERGRDAVEATKDDDRYRADRLSALSGALLSRFERQRGEADADEAVKRGREAIGATVAGEPSRIDALVRLRRTLQARLDHAGSSADRDELAALDRLMSPAEDNLAQEPRRPRSGVPGTTGDGWAVPAGELVRGIVISGTITSNDEGGYSFSGENTGVRAVALYWDKAVWVYGNGMGYRKEDELRFVTGLRSDGSDLERAGFLQLVRRDVYHPAWDLGEPTVDHGRVLGVPIPELAVMAEDRIRGMAIELNDDNASESWSIGQATSDITELPDPRTETRPALVLTMALPVPPDDIPVGHILDFRQRHRESLLGVRRAIENVANPAGADVSAALDDLRRCLSRVDRQLGDAFAQRWAQHTQVVLVARDAIQYPATALTEVGPDALSRLKVECTPLLSQVPVRLTLLMPGHIADFSYVFAAERFACS